MSKFTADNRECSLHIKTEHCIPVDILNKISDGAEPIRVINNLKNQTNCSTELCILESQKIGNKLGRDLVNKIINENFKVKGPKHDIEKWLSNDDIDLTLNQWTKIKLFSNYEPIPFQMRDFQKNNTELATMDFKNSYDNGIRMFACVLNTDWSSGSGQHWFALFFDFRKNPFTIEYFNSSGECPLREFNEWMNETEAILQNKFNMSVKKIVVTRVQNQYDNSSCGCYSLYYIYSRLNNIPWQWFRQNLVSDKRMHAFRKFLFN